MLTRTLIALALVAVSVQALQWADLYAPPFESGPPQIAMGISCAAKDECYIAGGSNGIGFGVFKFNGAMGGYMSMVPMANETGFLMMVMSIGIGGTKGAPRGAAGGVGFLTGLQYMTSQGSFNGSKLDAPLVFAIDIRTDSTGKNVLVVDQLNNGVAFSSDYGVSFHMHTIPPAIFPSKNFSEASFGAMVDEKTWYVTFGSWPESNNGGSGSGSGAKSNGKKSVFHRNQRVSYEVAPNKEVKRVVHDVRSDASSGSGSSSGVYSAGIARTTDGGMTWEMVMSDVTDFYMQDIDCLNATFCMAVSQGAAASKVWLTTDGKNFKPIFSLPPTDTNFYALSSVRFASPTQVWVAGSLIVDQNAAGVFYYSLDAGATWKAHGLLPWIGDVTDMDILPDGTGYATAVTMLQTSTILRLYQGPVPPMPTPPPTQASTGTITQIQCPQANCTGECNEGQFGTGMCVQLNGGGSIIMTCNYNPSSISQQIFNESETCSGPSFMAPLPTNTCEFSPNGPTWFESMCTPPSEPTTRRKNSRKFLARMD